MVVGVLTLELFLSEANSLKGKRKILKSLLERLKHRFNISVAEVGRQDSWKHSTIGISAVSGETSHMDSILSTVVNFIENHGGVEIVEIKQELL